MTRIVNVTEFNGVDLHNPGNDRYSLGIALLPLKANVKLFELPDGVLYNPYGGGLAPIYPQSFKARFLFRGSSPAAAQTMYQEVAAELGQTAFLSGTDANNTAVTVSAILESIVRVDTYTKAPSKVIKFELTFQPLSNTWS